MDATNFMPWLMLASTLAFILVAPLLSNELPDYEPASTRKRKKKKPQ